MKTVIATFLLMSLNIQAQTKPNKMPEQNIVKLSVSFERQDLQFRFLVGGGCGEHRFEFLNPTGADQKIYKEIEEFYIQIKHESNDSCRALITQDRNVDLKNLLADYLRQGFSTRTPEEVFVAPYKLTFFNRFAGKDTRTSVIIPKVFPEARRYVKKLTMPGLCEDGVKLAPSSIINCQEFLMVSPDGQARLLQTDILQRATYTLNKEGDRLFVDIPSQTEFDRHDDLRLVVNADESLQEEFYDRASGQMKLGDLWILESK